MATEKHRRAQIIDALAELFEPLREDSDDPYDVSEFPLQVKTVQKRYRALDNAGWAKGRDPRGRCSLNL